MDRYLPVYGPNSHQWWVYDEIEDVYIDPPAVILDAIEMLSNRDWEIEEKLLNMHLRKVEEDNDPDAWVYDREYWYKDIEI